MRKWSSIEVRLPVLISGLLLLAIGTFTWLAYRHVGEAVTASAGEQLSAAARQVAGILEGSVRSIEESNAVLAADAALLRYIEDPDESSRQAADERLRQLGTTAQGSAAELWSAEGQRLLSVSNPPAATPALGGAGPVNVGASPLRAENGTVYYEVAAAVVGGPAGPSPAGWVVQRRVLSSGPTGELLAGLIGEEARILVTNRDGDVWTDLSQALLGPPIAPGEGREVVRYRSAGGEGQVAGAAAIPGTPWIAWVERPERSVMAPARTFLRAVTGTAALIVLLGTGGAFLLSRRITTPVLRLSKAASDLSQGDYSRRVGISGNDEIGILADSFNRMAAKIADAHHRLEDQVAERTTELETANRQLVEAQEELVRKERLAILGQLAGGVGHELRNPLGVMTNAVYYLEMMLQEAPENVAEYLGILRAQIGLSEKIVNDLLDFARVRPPQVEPVGLRTLVDTQLERMGPHEGILIETDLPEDLPRAMVDGTQIGQVLLNVFTNGVQAMAEGGGLLRVRGRAAGEGRVELTITDEGEGIPPENLERIFEPLFTTKARGIGLGLAVSRALAVENGGALLASASPDRGASFTLVLPTGAVGAPR